MRSAIRPLSVLLVSCASLACGRVAGDGETRPSPTPDAAIVDSSSSDAASDAEEAAPSHDGGGDVRACLDGREDVARTDAAPTWARALYGGYYARAAGIAADGSGRAIVFLQGGDPDLGDAGDFGRSHYNLVVGSVDPATGVTEPRVLVDNVFEVVGPQGHPFAVGVDGTIAMLLLRGALAKISIGIGAEAPRDFDAAAGEPLLVVIPPDPTKLWAARLPGAYAVGVGPGPDPTIAVLGNLDRAQALGGVELVPTPSESAYAVSFEAGVVRWARALPGHPRSNVAIGADGLTAAVTFEGHHVDSTPGDSLSDVGDLHVLELGRDGSVHADARGPGERVYSDFDTPIVQFDAAGALLVVGGFSGTLRLGALSVTAHCIGNDLFLATVRDGALADLVKIETDDIESVGSVSVVGSGLVLGGTRMCLGHHPLVDGRCGSCAFVTRVTRDGTRLFDEHWGPSCQAFAATVAGGPTILAGSIDGTIKFGSTTLAAPGPFNSAAFLVSVPTP